MVKKKKSLGTWSPAENGVPMFKDVPATGCRVPQRESIPETVLVEMKSSSRAGRIIPKGGRNNFRRAMQPYFERWESWKRVF